MKSNTRLCAVLSAALLVLVATAPSPASAGTGNDAVAFLGTTAPSTIVLAGEQASFTAVSRDASNQAVAGATPRLRITNGPNAGVAIECASSDATGASRCIYPTGAFGFGVDDVDVWVDQTGGTAQVRDQPEPYVRMSVDVRPARTTDSTLARYVDLTPSSAAYDSGRIATLAVRVTTAVGAAVQGMQVTFHETGAGAFRNGSSTASPLTDSNGMALVEVVTFPQETGQQQVTAVVPGSGTQCAQPAGQGIDAGPTTPAGNCSDTSLVQWIIPPSATPTPYPSPYASAYPTPYASAYPSPYPSPYASAYPTPYASAFPSPYPSPYASAYASPYPSPYPTPLATPLPSPAPAEPSTSLTTTVAGGETVSTGDTATVGAPVQTTVVVPAGIDTTSGDVLTIESVPAGETTTTGYDVFGQLLHISGPPATGEPYSLTFAVDASLLDGTALEDVQVFRNGVALPRCEALAAGSTDPCLSARSSLPDGDVQLTVRTWEFSYWGVGVLRYDLQGPFAPLRAGAVHAAKAGSTVPVRFSLGGDLGADVLAPGSPVLTSCSTGHAVAPSGDLRYHPGAQTYTYAWKTAPALRGCHLLTLRFRDGSELRAQVSLR